MLSSAVEHWIADPQVTGSIPVVPSLFLADTDPGVGLDTPAQSHTQPAILVGVVGNISACHADARGSIPRRGAFLDRSRVLK